MGRAVKEPYKIVSQDDEVSRRGVRGYKNVDSIAKTKKLKLKLKHCKFKTTR